MAYQTLVNSDNSISVTVPPRNDPLFNVSIESIEALPVSVHRNMFVSSGLTKDVGWTFRSKVFKSPTPNVKNVLSTLDAIKQFLVLQRAHATLQTQHEHVNTQYKRQEKKLAIYENRNNVRMATSPTKKEPGEMLGNMPVEHIIENKTKLKHDHPLLDSYNYLVTDAFDKLSGSSKKGSSTKLVKFETVAYYITDDQGLVKVENEYSI